MVRLLQTGKIGLVLLLLRVYIYFPVAPVARPPGKRGREQFGATFPAFSQPLSSKPHSPPNHSVSTELWISLFLSCRHSDIVLSRIPPFPAASFCPFFFFSFFSILPLWWFVLALVLFLSRGIVLAGWGPASLDVEGVLCPWYISVLSQGPVSRRRKAGDWLPWRVCSWKPFRWKAQPPDQGQGFVWKQGGTLKNAMLQEQPPHLQNRYIVST